MAEKRKLLAEIEKCYKKIDEGVELFEETMDKMHEANSDNQRDKYQDDLKKEIKKLQRLRDQVKNWQNSSDIKDKEKLVQYRRLIEQRMEQFKDVERENKTKPHSKLGLSAEEKLDPKEKEKADTMDWIQTQIRSLNEEVDRSEMQLESLSNADTGKKRGKKEDLKTKNERERRQELLKRRLERLNFHIEKLEVCMRMISNDALNAKEVYEVLKDPIEAYVELMDNQEDEKDAYDPEDAYDDLNLETLRVQNGCVNLLSVDEEHKENGHDLGIDTETGGVSSSRHGSGENGQPPSPAGRRIASVSLTSPHQSNHLEKKHQIIKEPIQERPKSPLSSTPATAPAPPPPGIPYNSVAAGRSTVTPVPTTPTSVTTTAATIAKTTNSISSTPIKGIESVEEVEKKVINQQNESVSDCSGNPCDVSEKEKRNSDVSEEQTSKESVETPSSANKKDNMLSNISSYELSEPPSENVNGDFSKTSAPSSISGTTSTGASMTDDSALRALRLSTQNDTTPVSTEPKRAHIPAWLGASPLGRAPNTQEYDIQLAALEVAITKSQLPFDSERPRSYLPKLMFPVPPYYTQTTPANSDSLEYYLRLSPDTLFFIFYYMEGTRAQLLAAKALKRLSWRFHTKYLTWFQRHEEPKQITDDYELGTYVYFDFEKWSQRKKEAFTFEYKFLEDKEFD